MPDDDEGTEAPPRGRRQQAERPLTRTELLSILDERSKRDSEPEDWRKLGDYIEERSHKGSVKALEEWEQKSKTKNSPASSQEKAGTGTTLLERLLGATKPKENSE